MIDFKKELERYKPIIEVDDIDKSLKTDEVHDIIDLLEDIVKNIKKNSKK